MELTKIEQKYFKAPINEDGEDLREISSRSYLYVQNRKGKEDPNQYIFIPISFKFFLSTK